MAIEVLLSIITRPHLILPFHSFQLTFFSVVEGIFQLVFFSWRPFLELSCLSPQVADIFLELSGLQAILAGTIFSTGKKDQYGKDNFRLFLCTSASEYKSKYRKSFKQFDDLVGLKYIPFFEAGTEMSTKDCIDATLEWSAHVSLGKHQMLNWRILTTFN